MRYTAISDYVYEIGGKTFELYSPAYTGAFFDEEFNFIGAPSDPSRRSQADAHVATECDYYAYCFGGVWYMLPRGSEEDVRLVRLKYLGDAAQELPTLVFLGVHGQYEIMSGMGTYEDWCRKARFLGVKTLGICEKNTLAGALKFQAECKNQGLKPVIGMECSVYDRQNEIRFTAKAYARTSRGWNDLLTLNEEINCKNTKYVDLSVFREVVRDNDDLIVLLDPKTLDYDKLAGLDLGLFFYQLDPCEYTDNTRDEAYLRNLQKFYRDPRLQPVPAVDAWYLDEEYSGVRQRLSSIGGTTFYDSENQYFKSNDQVFTELARMFPDTEEGFLSIYERFSEGLECLEMLADSVEFEIQVKNRHLPRYKMTKGEREKYPNNEALFWGLLEDGLVAHPELVEKWGEEVVAERIDREVGVIKLGDAIDYFLITRDIINWGHKNGIMTGVARGSAGGCLVSYLLGITKLEPLEYNLLFERFLNAGRVQVSLPDIDVDWPGVDRPKIKKYMEGRYGWNQVCSVGTYSSLQLRAAIKDMARVYGLSFQETNDMMKLFDEKDREPEDLFRIACAQSRVRRFVMEHSDLVNEAMLIMPAPKAQSIHACAMMIFPEEHDMFHWVPIRKQGDEYVTEWEGGEMDAAGFLKEDVLGVKQLDKFQDMVRLIKEHEGDDVDIFKIPLDDPEVYRYFQNGWNEDNFHFGSKGLTGYCRQLRPTNIEDLIVAISIYRPGAMENGFHEKYIKIKEGQEGSQYFVGTEDILKNTYGVFCIAENSEVLCERGLVKIQEIIPGVDKVKTEDGSWRTVYLKKNNGVQPTVCVRSNFGRDVICTDNHKFLTRRGWVEAKDLKKNDELKCWFEAVSIRTDNLSSLERLRHWLLGYFIAEGSCASTPYYTVTNIEVANKLCDLIKQAFPNVRTKIKIRKIQHRSGKVGSTIRVCVAQKFGENNGYFNKNYQPNEFVSFLKNWGVWGKNCYTKRLPADYSLDMLIGIIEGDGCLSNYNLKMCNYGLMRDIYFGLQSYGVHSALFDRNGEPVLSWKDFGKFNYRILSSKKLTKKSSTNYGWGRVKCVTPMGESPVYDLSIEDVHSFTVNGCVVANCYQEQIMELCKKLGGLSLVEADDVRKAMVKKKYEALQQYHERFVPYYMEHFGVSNEYAEHVWDAIDKASMYLFNRSHAAAYAITGYISQWMKVHYPIEYWSVAFKYAQTDDYPRYIAEINRTGVCTVRPVDINISEADVVIDFKEKALYWSILGVKQVAEKAAEQILSERQENGQYWSLEDFVSRHKWKGSAVNTRIVQNLILAGAFDRLERISSSGQRIELLVNYLASVKKKVDDDDNLLTKIDLHKIDDWWWALLQKSVSGLAFFDYEALYKRFIGEFPEAYEYVSVGECNNTDHRPNDGYVVVAGYVSDLELKKTRKGEVMCKMTIESNYDFLNVVVFQQEYRQLEDLLVHAKNGLILMNGTLAYDARKDENMLRANLESNIVLLTL